MSDLQGQTPRTSKVWTCKRVVLAMMHLLSTSVTVKVDGKPVGYVTSLRGSHSPCLFIPISEEDQRTSDRDNDQLLTKEVRDEG